MEKVPICGMSQLHYYVPHSEWITDKPTPALQGAPHWPRPLGWGLTAVSRRVPPEWRANRK